MKAHRVMRQHFLIANLTYNLAYSPRAFGSRALLKDIAEEGWPIASLIRLMMGEWEGTQVALLGEDLYRGDLPPGPYDNPARFAINSRLLDEDDTNADELAVELCPFGIGDRRRGHHHTPLPDIGILIEEPRPLPNTPFVILNDETREIITPAGFGDAPTLDGALLHGGEGGFLAAFAVLIAASARTPDIASTSPLVGAWAGQGLHVCHPSRVPAGVTNRDAGMREVMAEAGWASYRVDDDGTVLRFSVGDPEPEPLGAEHAVFGVGAMSDDIALM